MVDPVALHIHERVSTQAILRVAAREDVNRSLFADPEQEYNEAVQFYKHDVDWSNRLILGDSLQVMSSLARREDLAGKVQMIYIDPPYGIKFGSNFQPEIGKREVKDKESDLTREPEMVKAYRDTWTLGVHSYLAYLRDRLTAARELLAETGSVFVQISVENLHHVRELLDEVFGQSNFCTIITFQKTTGAGSPSGRTNLAPEVSDHLIWYARDKSRIKYRQMYTPKTRGSAGATQYEWLERDGCRWKASAEDLASPPEGGRFFAHGDMTSQSGGETTQFEIDYAGERFYPSKGGWKTNRGGVERLTGADRLLVLGNSLRFIRYVDDFPCNVVTNFWTDTIISGFGDPKVYAVQTLTKVVERCVLMTSDPGDLVLDMTCGSGTTAVVAEQWGRRWIMIDTSRVAVAIARQRLLTAKYEYFVLKDEFGSVGGGFRHRTVPHVTLKSIVQNANLDAVITRQEPILNEKLDAANAALASMPMRLRNDLRSKLALKLRQAGKKSVIDTDRRRWDLPAIGKSWEHWEVPFDTDPDYPADLKKAVEEYRAAWRAKMDEVNACIAANADQEELVDQPEVDRKITRVSGPFTVEAVQPPEMSLGDVTIVETGFAGEPDELSDTFAIREVQVGESAQNLEAYLSKMVDLLRMDGVRFPDNKQKKFTRLDPIYATGSSAGIHAEGRWANVGETDDDPEGDATVGVVFGPQYGPITAKMIEEVIKPEIGRAHV